MSGGPYGPKGRENLFNTGLLFTTFAESTVCFVSGSHYLKRVLFVLCLGALTGPGEFGLILRLYDVKVNMLENISYFSLCMVPNWSRCQIGTGAKLTPFTLLVPNWSGAKLTPVPN